MRLCRKIWLLVTVKINAFANYRHQGIVPIEFLLYIFSTYMYYCFCDCVISRGVLIYPLTLTHTHTLPARTSNTLMNLFVVQLCVFSAS